MSLKNTDVNVEYPYVFMVTESIQQRTLETPGSDPVYPLSLIVKFYKLVDGEQIFDPTTQLTIDVDDFYQLALSEAINGDMTYLQVLAAQQSSVKKLVESRTGFILEEI